MTRPRHLTRATPFLSIVAPLFALACGAGGRGHGAEAPAEKSPLAALRNDAHGSSDGEEVGRWALAEMTAVGGDAAHVHEAVERLRSIGHDGLYASLARGIEAEGHGLPASAAAAYVDALTAGARSNDAAAPLASLYAAAHLKGLRGSVHDLYKRYAKTLDALVAHPERLGWRAAAEVVEWKVDEDEATTTLAGEAREAALARVVGCARNVRLAGPFGHGAPRDRKRRFPAESPLPWPPAWEPDARSSDKTGETGETTNATRPEIIPVIQHRCAVAASGPSATNAVYYAETFANLPLARDVLLAAQGATALFVDGTKVLERNLDAFGDWGRFGVLVHLGAGRHRIVAKLLRAETSIRLLHPDGSAAEIATDGDPRPLVSADVPKVLADPNPLERVRQNGGPHSSVEAFLTAFAQHTDAMDDAASVTLLPYVSPNGAAPMMLEAAALDCRQDPARPEDQRRRDERELRTRAVLGDPKLWYSRAWLAVDAAEQKGAIEAVEPLRALTAEFPEEPEILAGLARLYAKLGWRGERLTSAREMVSRFPDDQEALEFALAVLDEEGPLLEADAIAAKIAKLDPDSDVAVARALARHDWTGARAELLRLSARRPDRQELAKRLADVMIRSGEGAAAEAFGHIDHVAILEAALKKNPKDPEARFRLADARLARGDESALPRAIADALKEGGSTKELERALELETGAVRLEPYRIDGRSVIKEFEAWEKKGRAIEGQAARVLDYSALWVHEDGSSEMLEHEIQRVQSQEAVGKESEQAPPEGIVLKMRVIKKDGSILEPEPVAGKPTLTMPHLEVGDYLEIEHVTRTAREGDSGRTYHGPTWFFREEDKGYWRSEFVVVTPSERKLDVEARGQVPEAKVKSFGAFTERRWRVDESPPVPEEPDSPPIQEFLPSVRVGFGITLDSTVERLVDAADDATPVDPRCVTIANDVVRGVPDKDSEARARRLYKHVLEKIEEGRETDPRRVLLGRSGSRQSAFVYLARVLGIPVELGIVKSRLAAPPVGPLSEVEAFDHVAVRLSLTGSPLWMSVRDKFSPFGTLPSEERGQLAIRLVPGAPRETTTSKGASDGIGFAGKAILRADGSATLDLLQSFTGKAAAGMRGVFDKVPEGERRTFVERRFLAADFPGARLKDVTLEHQAELDEPFVVHMRGEAVHVADRDGPTLRIKNPFPLHVGQLATLPERQTPLLLGTSSHADIHFEIVVPPEFHPTAPPEAHLEDDGWSVHVRDHVAGHSVLLERVVDVPAGRVPPGDEYARFVRFVQGADRLLDRDLVLAR